MFGKMKKKKLELENDLISEESFSQSRQSYLGILTHCDGYEVGNKLNFMNIEILVK